jgi:hypothetical protein
MFKIICLNSLVSCHWIRILNPDPDTKSNLDPDP